MDDKRKWLYKLMDTGDDEPTPSLYERLKQGEAIPEIGLHENDPSFTEEEISEINARNEAAMKEKIEAALKKTEPERRRAGSYTWEELGSKSYQDMRDKPLESVISPEEQKRFDEIMGINKKPNNQFKKLRKTLR